MKHIVCTADAKQKVKLWFCMLKGLFFSLDSKWKDIILQNKWSQTYPDLNLFLISSCLQF